MGSQQSLQNKFDLMASGWWYCLGAALLVALGVKTNRMVRFIYHFLVFGQVLPLVALFSYPIFRVLRIYHGPPGETVSRLWSDMSAAYFRCKFKKIGDGDLFREKCMYVFPHRSWSDFFVHRIIAEGRGSNLSRWMVVAVFPLFYVVTAFDRSVFWFNRSKVRGNIEIFNSWLSESLNKSYLPAVISYPEGTRNPTNKPRELKKGTIYFAYIDNLPIQVICSKGNDDIVNEKRLQMGFGREIVYKYGKVIKPEDYQSKEDFFNAVSDEFHLLFAELYEGKTN